jgi:hypothetical protein
VGDDRDCDHGGGDEDASAMQCWTRVPPRF